MSKETFDQRDVFTREIRPLIQQLFDRCSQHNIPLLCFAVGAAQKEESSYIYDCSQAIHGHMKHMPVPMEAMVKLTELSPDHQAQILSAITVIAALTTIIEQEDKAKFN